MTTPTLLFDVNETLLDIAALDASFDRMFGDAGARQQWFLTLQTLWMTSTLVDDYKPFSELGRAALHMTARRRSRDITPSDADEILTGMMRLPPHPDVPPALDLLASVGVRLAVLTNGTTSGVHSQLRHAKIDRYFDAVFSVDEVKRYKPAPEPYKHAVHRLGTVPKSVDLVSVHSWDVAGARAAGLVTIFVQRPGHPPNPADRPADITVADIGELARNIAAKRR